jgi:leader peptidase (prepilin peptidase)/N-methyltransferase
VDFTLADFPVAFLQTFAVVFGLLWGSFLNVVIYRLPREMSVVTPGSRCPACGTPIRAWNNIPVVSYALQRGRARCCGAKMSPRYLVVELLGGGLSLAILQVLVLPEAANVSIPHALALYALHLALALGLLAAAFIDAEQMYLPDSITLGGAALGLATASFRGLGFVDALIGAAIGFVAVWLPFVFGYERLTGRAGMGLGDAKLAALAGAWFGWPGMLFSFFGGAVQGTLVAITIYLVRGRIEEPEAVRAEREELRRAAEAGDEEAKQILEEDPLADEPEEGLARARIPFGPFIILGCLEFLFFGPAVLEGFLGLMP